MAIEPLQPLIIEEFVSPSSGDRQSSGPCETFYINGFRPAWRFVGAAQREILTEMTLGRLSELALDDLAGPTYDAISA